MYGESYTESELLYIEEETALSMYHAAVTEQEKEFYIGELKGIREKIDAQSPVPRGTYTGYTDRNGQPIFVGDTIREGCNGLQSTIIWDPGTATFVMQGLGTEYRIEDAPIKWTKTGSYLDGTKEYLENQEPEW